MDGSRVSYPRSFPLNTIVENLRKLNAGWLSYRFCDSEQLKELVETVTIVADKRRGELHLSCWMSLEEMIAETTVISCLASKSIPFKIVVRCQFTSVNPYSHAVVTFTGKNPNSEGT